MMVKFAKILSMLDIVIDIVVSAFNFKRLFWAYPVGCRSVLEDCRGVIRLRVMGTTTF